MMTFAGDHLSQLRLFEAHSAVVKVPASSEILALPRHSLPGLGDWSRLAVEAAPAPPRIMMGRFRPQLEDRRRIVSPITARSSSTQSNQAINKTKYFRLCLSS